MMRAGSDRYCARAFTLIELLVVIGILAILMAVLVPTARSIFQRQARVKASQDVQRIATAWKSYYAEYGRWPQSLACEGTPTGQMTRMPFVALMTTRFKEGTAENPKELRFMEFGSDELLTVSTNSESTVVEFLDPWGMPYRFLLDVNFDGRTVWQLTAAISNVAYDTVMVWSAGPDTNDSSVAENADIVASWQ